MFERCLYFNANALVRKLNRIWDEAYAQSGLSAPHAYMLRLCAQHPGLSQQKIAEELRLEKSTITRFINTLIDKKLLNRQKGHDGRENLLFPTAAGKRLAKELDSIGQKLYRDMSKRLGDKQFNELVRELREAQSLID
jgi:DNA-binding MarR family transcriptional regulator